MAGVKRQRDSEINEVTRSWAFVLFKDYVAANGDQILKSLLPMSAPSIFPQFVITKNVNDFRKIFGNAVRNGKPFLWRLEAVMEGGAGHHFLISVNPGLKKITILDPAISQRESSLYSTDEERVQIGTVAKEFGYEVKDAPLPSACQPIVASTIDYLDTTCQTWSLLLAIDSVIDENLPNFQFKSPTTKQNLDQRVNMLKSGIQKILPLVPSSMKYQIQKYASSAEFENLGPEKRLYTDQFIVENMQSILLPENQHELVSDYIGYKKWGSSRRMTRRNKHKLRKTKRSHIHRN